MTKPYGGSGQIKGARVAILAPRQKADATLTQNNPVSTTLYEVLPATSNVRLIGVNVSITWAVTQPTPLEVVITADGQTIIYAKTNPVTATAYATRDVYLNADQLSQLLDTTTTPYRPYILEGRRVRVQVRVTWAVTQPTPLVARVRYAQY